MAHSFTVISLITFFRGTSHVINICRRKLSSNMHAGCISYVHTVGRWKNIARRQHKHNVSQCGAGKPAPQKEKCQMLSALYDRQLRKDSLQSPRSDPS